MNTDARALLHKNVFVSLLLVALGLFSLGVASRAYFQVQNTSKWRSTTGHITYKYIRENKWRRPLETTWRKSYWPLIEYEYGVAGNLYRGDKVRLDDSGMGTFEHATAWVEKYKVGDTVIVFYDPENPSVSVLEVYGTRRVTTILLITGILEVVLGANMFHKARRAKGQG